MGFPVEAIALGQNVQLYVAEGNGFVFEQPFQVVVGGGSFIHNGDAPLDQ